MKIHEELENWKESELNKGKEDLTNTVRTFNQCNLCQSNNDFINDLNSSLKNYHKLSHDFLLIQNDIYDQISLGH